MSHKAFNKRWNMGGHLPKSYTTFKTEKLLTIQNQIYIKNNPIKKSKNK